MLVCFVVKPTFKFAERHFLFCSVFFKKKSLILDSENKNGTEQCVTNDPSSKKKRMKKRPFVGKINREENTLF